MFNVWTVPVAEVEDEAEEPEEVELTGDEAVDDCELLDIVELVDDVWEVVVDDLAVRA